MLHFLLITNTVARNWYFEFFLIRQSTLRILFFQNDFTSKKNEEKLNFIPKEHRKGTEFWKWELLTNPEQVQRNFSLHLQVQIVPLSISSSVMHIHFDSAQESFSWTLSWKWTQNFPTRKRMWEFPHIENFIDVNSLYDERQVDFCDEMLLYWLSWKSNNQALAFARIFSRGFPFLPHSDHIMGQILTVCFYWPKHFLKLSIIQNQKVGTKRWHLIRTELYNGGHHLKKNREISGNPILKFFKIKYHCALCPVIMHPWFHWSYLAHVGFQAHAAKTWAHICMHGHGACIQMRTLNDLPW